MASAPHQELSSWQLPPPPQFGIVSPRRAKFGLWQKAPLQQLPGTCALIALKSALYKEPSALTPPLPFAAHGKVALRHYGAYASLSRLPSVTQLMDGPLEQARVFVLASKIVSLSGPLSEGCGGLSQQGTLHCPREPLSTYPWEALQAYSLSWTWVAYIQGALWSPKPLLKARCTGKY